MHDCVGAISAHVHGVKPVVADMGGDSFIVLKHAVENIWRHSESFCSFTPYYDIPVPELRCTQVHIINMNQVLIRQGKCFESTPVNIFFVSASCFGTDEYST